MANRKPSSLPKFKGQVESVFEKEFLGFTAECRLSKRESDIVMALLRNVTNSEDVARILSISTHTVNNHLKSIFEKTGTSSKTEILSLFLCYTAEFFEAKRLLVRKPRILILDSDLANCERVALGLAEKGFKTFSLQDPRRLSEYLGKYPIDCVVCNLELQNSSGLTVLGNLRSTHCNWPHFLLVAPSKQSAEAWSLEEVMHAGASSVLLEPLDIDLLGRTILSYLSDMNDRDHFLPNSSMPPVVIDESKAGEETQIGFGGAFVPMEHNPETLAQLGIGSVVDVIMIPPTGNQETLRAMGQVVWKRSTETRGLRPGVGIRFVSMSDKDQTVFDRYIRENDVMSFIPLGRIEDTARSLFGIPTKVPSTGS